MHVLLIPSEEFLPAESHLAGIFQKHQAMALQKAGCKVGVLSVRQSLSVPMLMKAMIYRLAGKRVNNELDQQTIPAMAGLLWNKVCRISSFIRTETIEGLPVYRIDGFYYLPPSGTTNHIGWIKAGKAVWKHYCSKEGKPDVIHAHNAVYGGMLARLVSEKSGVPYVITEHSSFVARKLEAASLYPSIEQAYRNAASLFVVSPFLGEKLDGLFAQKLSWEVMPNVLDPEVEEAAMPTEANAGSPFIFTTIGSLIPVKRQADLIAAFHLQFAGEKDVQLKIAGDGELKARLEEQIQSLGLTEQVVLLDRIQRKEVIRLIDESDCLVLCSEFETFGVVLIEALSRGKPVVATACGGPNTIVQPGNGLLCKVGDVAELAASLEQVRTNYEVYDRKAIRQEALALYGSAQFGQRLKKKYEEILS